MALTCPKCGEYAGDDERFCSACNTDLLGMGPGSANSKPTCRRGHDLTIPGHVYYRADGYRACRLCRIKRQPPEARYRHLCSLDRVLSRDEVSEWAELHERFNPGIAAVVASLEDVTF